jgi:hypothetical protein
MFDGQQNLLYLKHLNLYIFHILGVYIHHPFFSIVLILLVLMYELILRIMYML